MKLLSIILNVFSTFTQIKGDQTCVSKLNESFVGNEQYWKMTVLCTNERM